MTIAALAAGVAASGLTIHAVSTLLAADRCRFGKASPLKAAAPPPVSIVQPLRGVESFSRETLASIFALDYPEYEILFCLADAADPRLTPLVELIKQRDLQGYAYDEARASFELLVRRRLGQVPTYFQPVQIDVSNNLRYDEAGEVLTRSLAVVRLRVGSGPAGLITEAADGNGPVHALDLALRKALEPLYPDLREIRLEDFRVRIINANLGTDAIPRVVIRNERDNKPDWWTLGVSASIIEASVEALLDAFIYELFRSGVESRYR